MTQKTYMYTVLISGADRCSVRGSIRAASIEEAREVAEHHWTIAMADVQRRYPRALAGELQLAAATP